MSSAFGGTVALTVAVAGTEAAYGYVSEAGAPGAPLRTLYRAGILAVAAALALLALSLRSVVAGPLVDLAVVVLGVAAPLAVLSGAVSCTRGCPLPPYESTSVADLTHAAASIAALLLAASAMALLAAAPTVDPRLRSVSRICAVLAVPLLALSGLAILLIGRGYVTGLLERAALGVALGWLVSAGLVVAKAQVRGRVRRGRGGAA